MMYAELEVGARVVVNGGRVVHTVQAVDAPLARSWCGWSFYGGSHWRHLGLRWALRLATPDDTRECPKCAKRMGAAGGVVLQREVKGG